jgi:hypothetical protein
MSEQPSAQPLAQPVQQPDVQPLAQEMEHQQQPTDVAGAQRKARRSFRTKQSIQTKAQQEVARDMQDLDEFLRLIDKGAVAAMGVSFSDKLQLITMEQRHWFFCWRKSGHPYMWMKAKRLTNSGGSS